MQVTSKKDQEQYWLHREKPHRFVTVSQFAKTFQSFHVGRKIGDELAIPFDKSKNHPAALTTKKYGVNKKELLKANFSREYLLMKRNSFVYIFKICQVNSSSSCFTCIICIHASNFFFFNILPMFLAYPHGNSDHDTIFKN